MAEDYKLDLAQVKAVIPAEDLKKDLALRKASELVLAEAKVGEAPAAQEEKPKRTRKKKVEETVEGEESAEKPKRTRKKKTEDEEPKAE